MVKAKYKEFMRCGEVEFTRGGNKKGPSYQALVDWVSEAWKDLDVDLIKRSFVQTGVTNTGEINRELLHSKLKDLVEDVNTALLTISSRKWRKREPSS